MSKREYKKYLAYKEADKIARGIQRGIQEIQEAREGKRSLKSAYELAHELWSFYLLLYLYDKSEMENVQTAFIEQILQKILAG